MTNKECSVAGCSRDVYSRTFCKRHYMRFLKYGNPLKGGAYREHSNNYYLSQDGEYFEVLVGNDLSFKIDCEDLISISSCTWHINNNGYPRTSINKKHKYLHNFLIGAREGLVVDHINGNKLDNRKVNLRFVTKSINNANKHISTYMGVTKDKTNNLKKPWKARWTHKGKSIWLGRYVSKVKALEAIKQSKKEYKFYDK